ncbi:MAG: CRISPR-associated protein Cas4 [Candidatus Hydrogenedentes bacterium]|nr:CRISPR-associated protein Cas4 [Candidatus Hydrogenedentota bacterium]
MDQDTYPEDDFLQLSGVQHFLFCPRQWALIHVEGEWTENRWTAEGKTLHDRADSATSELRGDVLTARSVLVRSFRLGISGKLDVLEFHRTEEGAPSAMRVPGRRGWWRPFPVEYKRGKPKSHRADEAQLCAQALCLEEMYGVPILEGALFYGKTRRRLAVAVDAALRELVEETFSTMHAWLERGYVPPPVYEKKCEQCSLMGICMPKQAAQHSRARTYLRRLFEDTGEAPEEHP